MSRIAELDREQPIEVGPDIIAARVGARGADEVVIDSAEKRCLLSLRPSKERMQMEQRPTMPSVPTRQ